MRVFCGVAALSVLLLGCRGDASNADAPSQMQSSVLHRQWSVGGSADNEFSFTSLSVHDVAINADNRIVLIDRDNHRVLVLSADGELVDSWSRKGDGPGELQFPLGVAVAPDGLIHVFDAARSRVIVFAPDGTFDSEHIVERERPFRARFLSDGTLVGSIPSYADSTRLFRDSGAVRIPLAALVRAAPRSTPPVCNVTDYPVQPIFSPELSWDASGTTVVASVGDFAITVFESGVEPRVLRRDTTRRGTSRELAARMLGHGPTVQLQGMKPCTVPADMVLEVAEIAPEMPAYSSLTLDETSHIWATRVTLPDEPAVADLYDIASGFLETIALGTARPVAFLRDGRMVSIERDRDDAPMLVVYTLTR